MSEQREDWKKFNEEPDDQIISTDNMIYNIRQIGKYIKTLNAENLELKTENTELKKEIKKLKELEYDHYFDVKTHNLGN